MELTGKVIIFDNETEAIEWYKTIKEIYYNQKVETVRMKMDGIIKKAREENNGESN